MSLQLPVLTATGGWAQPGEGNLSGEYTAHTQSLFPNKQDGKYLLGLGKAPWKKEHLKVSLDG